MTGLTCPARVGRRGVGMDGSQSALRTSVRRDSRLDHHSLLFGIFYLINHHLYLAIFENFGKVIIQLIISRGSSVTGKCILLALSAYAYNFLMSEEGSDK